MLRDAKAVQDTARELEAILGKLVECYAIPHTKMCMRWTKSTAEEYREEVVGWLEDYAKSFRRLPKETLPTGEPLAGLARRRLDEEVRRILGGENAAVERSYRDLFG